MPDYPAFINDVHFYQMHEGQHIQLQQAAMLNNLKKVFALTTKTYDSFDDLVRSYLVLGSEIFGLETGIVSHIVESIYTVMDVISNQDVIKRGDQYPLEGTYCREVYSSNQVLGFPCVGELPYMKDHPVYVNMKLEAYLSAPILVDNKLYGTLNFTSTQPRQNGFSEHERDLIILMAQAIGNFILLRDRENKLQGTNKRLKQLVGFVAHDLRNPLGAIQSMAKLGLKPGTKPDRRIALLEKMLYVSTMTLEFVHSLLELSALGTGKIETIKAPVLLKEIIKSSCEAVEELSHSKQTQIVFDVGQQLIVLVDKVLIIQSLTNLLINAIKYSPEGSDIVFSFVTKGEQVRVSLKNQKHESNNETENYQSEQRYRSVGFGIDIASEVISAHDSELQLEETDEFFTASFLLLKSDLEPEHTGSQASH